MPYNIHRLSGVARNFRVSGSRLLPRDSYAAFMCDVQRSARERRRADALEREAMRQHLAAALAAGEVSRREYEECTNDVWSLLPAASSRMMRPINRLLEDFSPDEILARPGLRPAQIRVLRRMVHLNNLEAMRHADAELYRNAR